MSTVYLDHAATTPPDPEITKGYTQLLGDLYANPSSPHGPGRKSRAVLEEARQRLADLLGAASGELLFTGGGTESLNLALLGSAGDSPGRIAISAVEHAAVFSAARFLKERMGWIVDVIEVDREGRVTAEHLSRALHEDTRLVCVMLANNEVGAINDISALVKVINQRAPRAKTIVDAVQAFAKRPFSVESLGADCVAITAHKLHGLKGIGALWSKNKLRPVLEGGAQEGGVRGGTQCAALAKAFADAAEVHLTSMNSIRALRDSAWRRLQEKVPEAKLVGPPLEEDRMGNNLNFLIPGLPGEPVVNGLAARGVCVSAGSACAKSKFSPVLTAMGYRDSDGAFIRLSPGRFNTEAEIEQAADVLQDVVAELREMYD